MDIWTQLSLYPAVFLQARFPQFSQPMFIWNNFKTSLQAWLSLCEDLSRFFKKDTNNWPLSSDPQTVISHMLTFLAFNFPYTGVQNLLTYFTKLMWISMKAHVKTFLSMWCYMICVIINSIRGTLKLNNIAKLFVVINLSLKRFNILSFDTHFTFFKRTLKCFLTISFTFCMVHRPNVFCTSSNLQIEKDMK